MERRILADLSEDVGTIQEVETMTWQFDDYRLKLIGEELCIVGGKVVADRELIKIEGPTILLDLLQTVKAPPPAYWGKAVLSEYIPTDGVIAWCKKYGLLQEDRYCWNFEFEIDGEPGYIAGEHGFKLHPARRQIAQLYEQFNLWQGLINDDIDLIRDNGRQVFIEDSTSDHEAIEKVKIYLPCVIEVKPSIILDFSEKYPRIKWGFSSLLEICRYELLLLMTRDTTETRRHLKTCKNPRCGVHFWTDHGNTRYCDKCNAKTVWEQNERKPRKKGR